MINSLHEAIEKFIREQFKLDKDVIIRDIRIEAGYDKFHIVKLELEKQEVIKK